MSVDEQKRLLSDMDMDEQKIREDFGLTAGQLQFRRNKLEEMDWDVTKFRQEYPLTLDECFQASGRSIFNKVNYQPTSEWKRHDPHMHLLDGHPDPSELYIIGADVGGGTGGDNSVAQIFQLGSLEQVGEWVDNRIEPDVFGEKLITIGKWFNEAFITCESNNHGILTLDRLRAGYSHSKMYIEDKKERRGANQPEALRHYGFRTTNSSKPFIVGKLRKFLKSDITIHSEALRNELSTFVETESGSLEAEEGCMDDRVIGCAMAIAGVEKGSLALLTYEPKAISPLDDPFTLDSMLNELNGRRDGFPIADQVIGN